MVRIIYKASSADEDLAKQKHCISPQKYNPSTKVEQILRFTKIGLGYGTKSSNEILCIIYLILQNS